MILLLLLVVVIRVFDRRELSVFNVMNVGLRHGKFVAASLQILIPYILTGMVYMSMGKNGLFMNILWLWCSPV
jgi:hypothetical protein